MHLSPNAISLLGIPLALFAAFFLSQGAFLLAAGFIVLLGGCDLLDGTLAKKKGLATDFGAFLDSTVDRITELFLFMGILLFYLREGSFQMAGVSFWVLGGSFVISYTRARAENLIENCRVGFWQRSERIVLILLGLLFGHLNTALWILLFGTTLTALHRILYTREILQKRTPSLPKLLFWDYPRKSWPYRFCALLVILLTLLNKLP